eukprot:9550509-Alexandrium_andersonii.AAC.1
MRPWRGWASPAVGQTRAASTPPSETPGAWRVGAISHSPATTATSTGFKATWKSTSCAKSR